MVLIQSFCMNESNKIYVLNEKKRRKKENKRKKKNLTKRETCRFLKNLLLC